MKLDKDRERTWGNTKEKILLFFGLLLIVAEFINAEVIGGSFHPEFLIGGFALCGISLTSWGDRK